MSDCCKNSGNIDALNNDSLPRKFNCPINDQKYTEVKRKTILQHLKSPWDYRLEEEKYYYCDDAKCDVVYFGLKGSIINKNELRTLIGKKEESKDTLICYCFGVSKEQAKNDSNIKLYVTQQTKENNCSCETKNPSGRCCLKDFPKNKTSH